MNVEKMKIIDLSHTISPEMPVYPGTEPPTFTAECTLENVGFVEKKITLYSHTEDAGQVFTFAISRNQILFDTIGSSPTADICKSFARIAIFVLVFAILRKDLASPLV